MFGLGCKTERDEDVMERCGCSTVLPRHSPELVLLVLFFSLESRESSKKKMDIFQERIKHRVSPLS